jgi:hypothetical protein
VKDRWALVVMGAWLAGSICSSVVATENFYTIDRLLASSPNAAFSHAVQQLGQPQARDLLRYLSSELNRLYFQMWNWTQLVLGATVLWLIVGRTRPDAYAARTGRVIVAMLATVVLMLVYLTPAIVSLGRELDFVPRNPEPPGMQRFWILHAAYTSLEMLKLAAGFLVAFWIARTEVRLKADATYETVRGVRL